MIELKKKQNKAPIKTKLLIKKGPISTRLGLSQNSQACGLEAGSFLF